ncbi:MAG: hypothetical protein MI757_08650 [Pirellulales bacterium]|nr:hypothetical protein [Pirellulales bacterium]
MLRTSVVMTLLLGFASAAAADDPYADKYAPPKKEYDMTRRVKLDRPFEVGKPGKTKYEPKTTVKTTEGVITQYGPNRSKYSKASTGTSKKYASTKSGSAASKSSKGGDYAPIERSTVLKYNEMVVEANKRLKTAGKLYGKALKPVFFDEEADLDEVKEAQDYLTARVGKIHKVMKAYNVPKTMGSDELAKTHMAFLNYQKEMVEGPLNKVMELLEDPNLKPEDKKEEIQKVLEDMRKQEVQLYLALKNAQDAYAEAHNIEIVRETIVKPGEGQKIKVGGKTIELNGKQISVDGRKVYGKGVPTKKRTYYKKTETR